MEPQHFDRFTIRQVTSADTRAVASLLDETVHWFTDVGNENQWGKALYSEYPGTGREPEGMCASPNTYVAELEGIGICGAIAFHDPNWWVPQVDPKDFYIRVLIGSRDPAARGVGRALLDFARAEAERDGYRWMRIDCYTEGTSKLREYFEANGYEPTGSFRVDLGQSDWPAVVLRRPVEGQASAA